MEHHWTFQILYTPETPLAVTNIQKSKKDNLTLLDLTLQENEKINYK